MPESLIADDRSLRIKRNSIILTRWISIDCCQLGCRDRMDVAAAEKAFRRYLQIDGDQFWPPIVGYWNEDQSRFTVLDGRHEYVALLMLGRTEIFVCWTEER